MGYFPSSRSILPIDNVHMRIDGREFIHFATPDPLGLLFQADVKKNGLKSLLQFGFPQSPDPSHMHEMQFPLEKTYIQKTGFEDALLTRSFSSLVRLLGNSFSDLRHYFVDRNAHPLIMQTLKDFHLPVQEFDSNDLHSLETLTIEPDDWIISTSVSYQSGEYTPLQSLKKFCKENLLHILIDDSLSTTLGGEQHLGVATSDPEIDLVISSLVKFSLNFPTVLLGKSSFVEQIRNSDSWDFPFALSSADIGMLEAILEQLFSKNTPIETLNANFRELKQMLVEESFPFEISGSVFFLQLSFANEQLANICKEHLWHNGFYLSPAIQEKNAKSSFTLHAHAAHTAMHRTLLTETLKESLSSISQEKKNALATAY